MGTGVVAFNVQPKFTFLCDSNPHLIRFYQAIQNKEITAERVSAVLEKKESSYKPKANTTTRLGERFQFDGGPDFLFLSRSS